MTELRRNPDLSRRAFTLGTAIASHRRARDRARARARPRSGSRSRRKA